MKAPYTYAPGEWGTLAREWRRSLEADNKSPNTVRIYLHAVRQLGDWASSQPTPMEPTTIKAQDIRDYMRHLLHRGSAGNAHNHYRSLRTFFTWLVDEEELDRSPMERTRAPQVPEKQVPIVTIEQMRALLDVCKGKDFADRRDAAILRVLWDTGGRRAEVSYLNVDDVGLDTEAILVHGKGRRSRVIPIGAKTGQAPRIRVTPRANTITTEMIDDLRPDWTVALGGILPIRDLTERIELTPCAYPGLTVYRRDRKWLEAWDGEAWRVVGTVATATPADITDPYVDQLIFNSRDRTLYRWAGEWIPVAGDVHGKGLVHARRRAQGATIASVITAETPIYQHSIPVQPSRVYRISARVPVLASEAATTTRVRIKAGAAYVTESGETVCPTAGNAAGVAASTVYASDPSQALLALTVSVERVAGRGALTVTVDREFPFEVTVEDLGGIPELVER